MAVSGRTASAPVQIALSTFVILTACKLGCPSKVLRPVGDLDPIYYVVPWSLQVHASSSISIGSTSGLLLQSLPMCPIQTHTQNIRDTRPHLMLCTAMLPDDNVKHTHMHPFNSPFSGTSGGLPRWASTRKVEPIWILLKKDTVSGSGISWAVCKSAPCSS